MGCGASVQTVPVTSPSTGPSTVIVDGRDVKANLDDQLKEESKKDADGGGGATALVAEQVVEEVTVMDQVGTGEEESIAFEWAANAHIGPGFPPIKKENQDVVRVVEKYGSAGDMVLAICLDGHGVHGKMIAEAVEKWLVENARTYFENDNGEVSMKTNEDWDSALTRLFIDCNGQLSDSLEVGFRNRMSGTTATVVVIYKNVVHIAGVGDSRAIIAECTKSGSPITRRLTQDHRPEDEAERKMIESAGGLVRAHVDTVAEDGPLRVWLPQHKLISLGFNRPCPGLMLTRSIGDEVAKMAGCCCEPSITHTKLVKSCHQFLVVGSDGIWDVMTDEAMASLVARNSRQTAQSVLDKIIDQLLDLWTKKRGADNISVILIRFV